MVTVDIDFSKYKDIGPATKEINEKTLNLTAQSMIAALMRNSPVDHGLLRQWAVTEHSATTYKIRSPAKYTAAQNWGSTHMIKPKSKKALHWGGSPGYFSKGHMVTIRGKHFIEDSISEVRPKIPENFQIAVKEVLG